MYICTLAYTIRVRYYGQLLVHPAPGVIGGCAVLFIFIGLAGYQANFIQLGLDQLITAPSEDLALFIHRALWAYSFDMCCQDDRYVYNS